MKPKSKIKIISVDDSPVVADGLKVIFSEMEDVLYAGNAVSASAAMLMIQEQQPDVVFLDLHLEPDNSKTAGLNLLLNVRKVFPSIKIIMLTNLAGNKYKETCLAFGADYFLDKTLDLDKIQPTVLKLLSEKLSD